MATKPNALYGGDHIGMPQIEERPNALYGRGFPDVLRDYPNQEAARLFDNWSQMSEPEYNNQITAEWMRRGQDVYGTGMGALYNSMLKRDDARQRSKGGAYVDDPVMQALRRSGVDPYSIIGGGKGVDASELSNHLMRTDEHWGTDSGAEAIDRFIKRFGLGGGS